MSLLARLGLAAVWLISGWAKASDAQESMVAVRAYDLVPESMVRTVAIGLPSLELALGLLLLLGLGVRWTAVVSALLLLVLIAGVASAWARGLKIDCGCFGGGGADASVTWADYAEEILRDVGFLLLALWLMILPRSPLALGFRSRAALRSGNDRDGDESDGGPPDGADGPDGDPTAHTPGLVGTGPDNAARR